MMRRYLLPLAALALLAGCVQPAYDKTVVYTVDVSGIPNVKSVGLRGEDNPLSWRTDLALTPIVKDSLYRVAVTYHTGYLKTEVKFTVNGEFEFQDSDNRRVAFSARDTTAYQARFNVRP
jgi:putative oxidoreductase